jgi:hypothetical protein
MESNVALGKQADRSFNSYSDFKTKAWNSINNLYSQDINISRYIIPIPFGPLEDYRLVRQLRDSIAHNQVFKLKFPLYVRDYVPIYLLRRHYKWALLNSYTRAASLTYSPSYYPESNRSFVNRYAQEMSLRLNLEPNIVESLDQVYEEPLVRINLNHLGDSLVDVNEKYLWDMTISDSVDF